MAVSRLVSSADRGIRVLCGCGRSGLASDLRQSLATPARRARHFYFDLFSCRLIAFLGFAAYLLGVWGCAFGNSWRRRELVSGLVLLPLASGRADQGPIMQNRQTKLPTALISAIAVIATAFFGGLLGHLRNAKDILPCCDGNGRLACWRVVLWRVASDPCRDFGALGSLIRGPRDLRHICALLLHIIFPAICRHLAKRATASGWHPFEDLIISCQ